MHLYARLAVIATLFAVPVSNGAEDPPPVFAKKTFDEARAATKGNDKILIVKATAVWCGPCKQMDKTTWRDEKIVKWFEANGLAIQIDVDKQPDVSKALNIDAMPTMVAFKNAEEFDRVVGYKSADEFLPWLEAVKKGERSGDKAIKQLAELKSGAATMSGHERMQLIQKLVQMNKLDEATEQYAELWESSKHEVGMGGVRGSFLAGDIERLAKRHPPAMKKFRELRDTLERTFEGDTKRDYQQQDDWIVLNEVVGESKRTLEWFDRIKDKPNRDKVLQFGTFRIERLLEENERWADLGRLWEDPIRELKQDFSRLEMSRNMRGEFSPEQKKSIEEAQSRNFREKVGNMYVGLLAAGRDKDAEELAGEAVDLDDTAAMRIALVNGALKGGQSRKAQLDLLAAAETKAAVEKNEREVARSREKLKAALEKR